MRPMPWPIVAALLALALLPFPVAAQSLVSHGLLEYILQSTMVPVFEGSHRVPGVSAKYLVSSGKCITRIQIITPPYTSNAGPHPITLENIRIDWTKTDRIYATGADGYIAVLTNRANYNGTGLNAPEGTGVQIYGGANRARLIEIMRGLRSDCTPANSAAPRPAPSPPASPPSMTDRTMLSPDGKTLMCRFTRFPDLVLKDTPSPARRGDAIFAVPPREPHEERSQFSVGVNSAGLSPQGNQQSNWKGMLATPYFTLTSPLHFGRQASSARVTIDGRSVVVKLFVNQGKYTLERTVSVATAGVGNAQLLTALSGGSIAGLKLFDAKGALISSWTFDVSTLRNVPTALLTTNWSCAGAR